MMSFFRDLLQMKLRHTEPELKQEGRRILDRLRDNLPLEQADLVLVRRIVDESESVAGGLTALYGGLFLLCGGVICILAFAFDIKNTDVSAGVLICIMGAMVTHYLYDFRCDNYHLQITNRLVCSVCSHRAEGYYVHELARNASCPNCNCSLEDFFACGTNEAEQSQRHS